MARFGRATNKAVQSEPSEGQAVLVIGRRGGRRRRGEQAAGLRGGIRGEGSGVEEGVVSGRVEVERRGVVVAAGWWGRGGAGRGRAW